MAEQTYVTNVQRESPDIEARKLALMDESRRLYEQPFGLPAIEAAGLSIGEQQAMDMARQGIGAFEPFIQGGTQAITQGMDLTQRGALAAGGVDTTGQFQSAQDVLGRGVGALSPMSDYQRMAGSGMQDIGAGIGRVSRAGDLAGSYMQADLRPATGSIEAAQLAAMQATPSDFSTSANILGGGMQGAADATGTAMGAATAGVQGMQQGVGSLYDAAAQGRQAAQLGAAPMLGAAERVGAGQLTAAQTGFRPDLAQYQMGPAQQVAANEANAVRMAAAQTDFRPDLAQYQMGPAQQVAADRVGIGSLQAAQTGFSPNLSQFQMGPAQQVAADRVGIGSLQAAQAQGPQRLTTSGLTPELMQSYMSPYMSNVLQQQMQEITRQDQIASQDRAAQAVRAGAFGGTREAVAEAEAARNVADLRSRVMAEGLQQAYGQGVQQFNVEQGQSLVAGQSNQQAQLQTALANLSAEQQARVQQESNRLQASGMNQQAALQAALSNQQAGLTVGQQNLGAQLSTQQLGAQTGLQTALANLSADQQTRIQQEANRLQASGMNQQAALQTAMANQQSQSQYDMAGAQYGLQAAQMLGQAGTTAIGAAGQGSQLGLQAAAQQFQQAGYDANTAMQMAQLQQVQQGQALQQSAALQGIGSLQGQQAMQQAQLGQSGAGLVGQLGAQQAQLGLLPGQVAQTQAGIAGQQAGLYGQLGQGIGGLTAQQAGVDLSKAQALGSLGTQMGGLGVQMGALGEATQQLGAADVGMLGQVGLLERQNEQAQLDAIRGTQMQEIMDPYQRLGFMSDIYRGAPTTQMSMTSQTAPSASPLQTAAGLGIGALSAGAAAKTAGLF